MNIRELLEKQAQKYSDKTFLYFEEEQITYHDFNLTINKVANAFKNMGISKGDMVALMLSNSPEFLYTWMGLNKIGAVEVPINVNFKEAEIKYILQHSQASGIIIQKDFYNLLSRIKPEDLPELKNKIYYGDENVPSGYILYTSGTTDRPKGVLNSHRNWTLTGEAYSYTVGITSEDRIMTPNPLFHANAQVYSTMGSLVAGASLVLLNRFSSSQILEQARRYNATKMVLVQAVTPWVWNRPKREDDGDNPIKKMIAGNVPIEIYYDFEERFQLKIQTIYSLTEAPFAIMGPREGTQQTKPGGIGVPMEHPNPAIKNEVKIVDDRGEEVPSGKQGEILIRNSATMLGYFKDPEKTAATKREGWIYTGDIGYQDEDDYFYFVGRKKEVIRRRGELISPTEIEAVINSHPSIEETAVIGVASGLGSGEEEVKAYIRLKQGGTITPQEIVSWCSGKLAEFKIPRFLEFREDFPKSAIGRIQKKILMEEKADPTDGCYDREKPA